MNVTVDGFDCSRLLPGRMRPSHLSGRALAASAVVCAAVVVIVAGLHTPGPLHYLPIVEKHASTAGVEPALVLAMISQESRGRPEAVSRKGALGLMQIMPETAREVAARNTLDFSSSPDLFDPETNIRIGVLYLARLLKAHDNDVTLALGAYNAGPGTMRDWRARHPGLTSTELCARAFYPETRHYVASVLRKRRSYRRVGSGRS